VQRIAPLSPVASDWRPGTRPLRVGLLSADFKTHSVSYFIEPLLARHDRDRLALVCYSNGSFGDTITLRLRDHATEWVGTATWSDSQLARRIREDAIDILVDLSGHTGGNRLSMLALKPAPVQVTWLGYPTTTGLPTIDYRITDARVDPPGYAACASERPLRLPASYFCYRPRSEPRIGPLPADAGRPITFGSFNNMPKLGAATIRLWSRVLHALPDATLFVKTKALADASVRDALLASFATEGICAQRLRAIGWLPSGEEHLAAYNEVDIALDTFPYNGATTTCEALWMGVPVVSLAGSTHASRMGLSILTAVGLPELVASSEDGFVALAAALAQERDRLRALRQTLRERMRASPLMDEAGHAAAVADALEAAMREHLGLAPVEAGGARP
jgi:predicted O-linked N-acetylglucosamine transferase (SPINDLY family)